MSSQKLQALVDDLTTSRKLVGASAVVRIDGEVALTAASGLRKRSAGARVTVSDRWHIGSITKAFTATMIAKLVGSGAIDFTAAPGDVLNEADSTHPQWSEVTLAQLLTNSGGAPVRIPVRLMRWSKTIEETLARRREAVRWFLSRPPESPPGFRYRYSNAGYLIAAHMAEVVTGLSWEQLISEHIIGPLILRTAGFGAPRGSEDLDEPWGHFSLFGWKRPIRPRVRGSDNPPLLGPAGTLHMTLDDLSLFGWEHIRGLQGQSELFPQRLFQLLHTPPELKEPAECRYAFGWIRQDKLDAVENGMVSWHDGSNALWYSLLVLDVARNAVVAFGCNDGSLAKDSEFLKEFVEEAIEAAA